MLYEFITLNRADIITRCRTKVAARLMPRPSDAEIDHGVPLFLEQLVALLRAGGSTVDIDRSAGQHGHEGTLDAKGSGRLELANWIASKDNPLTSRVMVNRIWQGHFGRGIVATPNGYLNFYLERPDFLRARVRGQVEPERGDAPEPSARRSRARTRPSRQPE